jgi:uncharacterized membrane protein
VPTSLVPSKSSRLATALAATGLLTCVYLAALKLLNLPCPFSGCASLINTRYGALLGVPLPIYAVPLWVALCGRPSGRAQELAQAACAWALALGAAVLMAIQFLVLRGFCPFCTLHAAAAITAAFVVPRRGHAAGWLPSAVLVATLPIFLAVRGYERSHLTSWQDQGAAAAAPAPAAAAPAVRGRFGLPEMPAGFDKAAFTWLGDFDANSPILIISFQCPHCLDLIQDVLTHPHNGDMKGPRIFVYAPSAAATSDTLNLMAAILSAPGSPQEQFAAVFSNLDSFRDALITRDSAVLKRALAEQFPTYPKHLAEAKRLFAIDMAAIKFIPGRGSPYLLLPDGTSKDGGDVTPEILFH